MVSLELVVEPFEGLFHLYGGLRSIAVGAVSCRHQPIEWGLDFILKEGLRSETFRQSLRLNNHISAVSRNKRGERLATVLNSVGTEVT